jgi:hypothetical protein
MLGRERGDIEVIAQAGSVSEADRADPADVAVLDLHLRTAKLDSSELRVRHPDCQRPHVDRQFGRDERRERSRPGRRRDAQLGAVTDV